MNVTEEEIKKYPWLQPRPGWYGPSEIPDNWKPVVLLLCEELSNYFDNHPDLDRNLYHLDQGKEKYGSACWYDSYGDETHDWTDEVYKEIHEIVHKYTAIMDQTCIACGSSNAKIRTGSWWYLLCDDCASKPPYKK